MSLPPLTRTILDTYLYFWIIYIEPKDDKKSIWLKDCYYLNGFQFREQYKDNVKPENKAILAKKIQDIENLRSRITTSKYFKSLDEKTKKKIQQKGGIYPHRNLLEKGLAAGYSKEFLQWWIPVLHDYVHGGGLSISHMDIPHTQDDIRSTFMNYKSIVATVLARLIKDYTRCSLQVQNWYNSISEKDKLVFDRYIAISSPKN